MGSPSPFPSSTPVCLVRPALQRCSGDSKLIKKGLQRVGKVAKMPLWGGSGAGERKGKPLGKCSLPSGWSDPSDVASLKPDRTTKVRTPNPGQVWQGRVGQESDELICFCLASPFTPWAAFYSFLKHHQVVKISFISGETAALRLGSTPRPEWFHCILLS